MGESQIAQYLDLVTVDVGRIIINGFRHGHIVTREYAIHSFGNEWYLIPRVHNIRESV